MDEIGALSLKNKPAGRFKNKYAMLDQYLQDVKDKQGVVGNLWDSVKSVTGVGVSEKKCNSMLEKYQKGEIDFEQAVEYIEKYDRKQDDTTNLIANVATGTAAIAATIALHLSGGLLLAVGAGIGAIAKTCIKFIDRATNNIKNDEFDTKLIAKDALTGGITGLTSSVQTSMFGKASKSVKSIIKGAGTNIPDSAIESGVLSMGIDGFVCGLGCGAFAGASNYLVDVGFGDKEFKAKDLAGATLTTAAVSAPVGGLVTAGASSVANLLSQTAKDCAASATKKFLSYEVNQVKHALA